MTHLERAELQIARGKPLALVRESLKLHFEEVDYQNWLSDKQAEYDSLFKTKEVIISATVDNDEVIDEQVTYEYIDDCIGFNDWLQEEVIIQEAIEPTYDEEGNLLLVGQLEIRELVRPYISKDVTSLVDSYLDSSYAEIRKATYKPIGEQLDMQYKDAINGTTTWVDYITSIKTSIPKV